MQKLLLAAIFTIFPAVGQSACYESGNTYHPLMGSAFCGSNDPDTCREKHFARDIKFTWDVDGPVTIDQVYGFYGAYYDMNKMLKSEGVKLTASTSSYGSSTPELRLHFRDDRVPSLTNCMAGKTDGSSTANGLACLPFVGPGYNGYSSAQWTKGHVKCDVWLNTTRLSDNTELYVKRTIMHEMGHCLGLDHISNTSELMYAYNQCSPIYSTQNCAITTKVIRDIEDGYQGFYSLPQDKPFNSDMSLNWTVYENWWDEESCHSQTGYNSQLNNGSSPNQGNKKRDGSSTCYSQIQYLTYFGWKNTSSTALCSRNACRVICR